MGSAIGLRSRGGRSIAAAVVLALVLWLALLFDASTNGERAAADSRSIEWVCGNQADRVRILFDSLNLDRPGLESVKHAVHAGDYAAACGELLAYYRSAPTAVWLRRDPPPESDRRDDRAEPVLADTFSFYNVAAMVPRTKHGGLDWSYDGPQDDPEWGWSLNSHSYFNTLTSAYFKTGRRAYVERIDADVRDWILSNPYLGRFTRTGSWRGILVAARAKNWMHAFYGLQAIDEFSPAARILVLSSLVEHAHYLLLFHRREASNWTVGEIDGLATIGAAWPEFKDAPGWRAYALEIMGRQMSEQVYPDGAQAELSVHYHRITTENFDHFVDVFRRFDHVVPDSIVTTIEKMWNYLAFTMRPDGTTPENNDSDRRDVRAKVTSAAASYRRSDWVFVAANGREGMPPDVGPSVVFPWAGHVVMRSGWDANAQWSFFDVGPWGIGHQHADKLHLSIDAHGRALLVDAGRLNYEGGAFRDYFTGSAAHNVILIDGRGQKPDSERAELPLAADAYVLTPEFGYARGTFSAGFDGVKGRAVHTRAVVYVRGEFWVVVDRIETDRPRSIEALWHFAPDCSVVVAGASVASGDSGKGNLRIEPVGGIRWRAALVAGAVSPAIQGWYSGFYNEKVPTPTAVFAADIPGTATFAWVLVPALGPVPVLEASVVSSSARDIEIRVESRAGVVFVVRVPMIAGAPRVERAKH